MTSSISSFDGRVASTGALNIAIMAGVTLTNLGFLWLASHAPSSFVVVAAAIGFGLFNNTMFSLMHEAVHGMFHGKRLINEAAGNFAAVFFPTVFSVQRLSHLTHHRNNRTDVECFDYYRSGDYHLLKVAQWYSILTGLYWLFIPVFASIYAVFGNLLRWDKLIATEGVVGRQTSAKPYFDALRLIPMWKVRAGFAFTILVQLLMFWALDLNVWCWAICYATFGLMWSSLQYADHAFSALHTLEGAWNLRVSRLVRLIYLNYHFHRCHHRDPTIVWRALPQAERSDDPTFAFTDILYLMWSGPRPLPGAEFSPEVLLRNQRTTCLFLTAIVSCIFMMTYGAGSYLSEHALIKYDLTTNFDRMFPFVPAFAVFYLCVGPLMLAAPFILKSPERLLPFGVTLVAEMLLALACYVAFPVSAPTVPVPTSGIFAVLFSLADTINLEGNNLPSLHIALSVSAVWAYAPFLSVKMKALAFLLATLIVASTMLLHQHVIADVGAGLLLAAFAMAFVYPAAKSRLQRVKAQLGNAVAAPDHSIAKLY
jgi:fatty acid desaturase